MKPYKKRYTKHVRDLIRHLPPTVKPFIRALTDELVDNPYSGKALKYDLEGYYSIRHNRYRVIYAIDVKKAEIIIEYVGSRESVYDLFTRLKQEAKKKN